MTEGPPATPSGHRGDGDRDRPVRIAMSWMDLINPEWFLGRLFARGIWQFAATIENKGLDDPVYKKNLQRLIDRNREFEEARNARNARHS
jgi:hypothetical protein